MAVGVEDIKQIRKGAEKLPRITTIKQVEAFIEELKIAEEDAASVARRVNNRVEQLMDMRRDLVEAVTAGDGRFRRLIEERDQIQVRWREWEAKEGSAAGPSAYARAVQRKEKAVKRLAGKASELFERRVQPVDFEKMAVRRRPLSSAERKYVVRVSTACEDIIKKLRELEKANDAVLKRTVVIVRRFELFAGVNYDELVTVGGAKAKKAMNKTLRTARKIQQGVEVRGRQIANAIEATERLRQVSNNPTTVHDIEDLGVQIRNYATLGFVVSLFTPVGPVITGMAAGLAILGQLVVLVSSVIRRFLGSN